MEEKYDIKLMTSNSDNIDSYIDMGIDLLLYDTNQFVRDGITSLKNKIK